MVYNDISPDDAVLERKRAYDKLLNLEPVMAKKQALESTEATKAAMRAAYKGVTQGGYSGREATNKVADQAQLELAKMRNAQRSEADALALQGAGAKEDIIAGKQKQALTNFNRQSQDMEDQMDRAIAERAFDLGMTAKELAFHMNSKIADIGLEEMKKDFDAGQISEQEMLTLKLNLERSAGDAQLRSKELMNELQNLSKQEVNQYTINQALELQRKIIAANKDMIGKQTKASNIATIISGTGGLIGGAVGFGMGGPAGGLAGSQIGGGAGSVLSGILNS